MVQLFVDREEELRFLEEKFSSRELELVVIYGRRRVGKTDLVARFMKGKSAVYFLADRRPERDLLLELREKMAHVLQDESFAKLEVKDWPELFEEFVKWWKGGRVIIVLDEFPTLIESNKAIPSIFQKIWDQKLKESKVMLILLGSSVGMMETDVLGYRSPSTVEEPGNGSSNPYASNTLRCSSPSIVKKTSSGFTVASAGFQPTSSSSTQTFLSGIT